MNDPGLLSATELTAALRRRDISSRELLTYYLGRIDDDGGQINAVVTIDEEAAYATAHAADEALAHSAPTGPLCGLPMTVKDVLETAGMRTTAGAREYAGHIPDRDADAVARLRDAGAVIFGKTNTAPYAMDFQTANPVFGLTRNPWDPDRTPGGSSGGPAAALAAGLTGFEIGSDLAGSIRQPAANCGVFGLKPSYGIVPVRGHIPGPPGTLATPPMSVLGPLGRAAADLELGLGVLAGPERAASVAWHLDLPAPVRAELGELRIAACLTDPFAPPGHEVARVLHDAVGRLRDAGANIDDTALPVSLADGFPLFQQILAGAASTFLPEPMMEQMRAIVAQTDPADASPAVMWARAHLQSVGEWQQALERRAHVRARWAGFFRDYDALLCPITLVPAMSHDPIPDPGMRTMVVDGTPLPYLPTQMIWPSVASLADLPAAVAPVGLTAEGLPVGIQIIAALFRDRTAVRLAQHVEMVIGRLAAPAR